MGITKRAAPVCVLLIAGALFAWGDDNDRTIPQAIRKSLSRAGIQTLRQKEAPVDFTLPFLDGAEKTLSAYKGKVVFLNFWATWCPPCRGEMPSMENLYQRFRDDGLELLGVDIQEAPGEVQEFMEEFGLSFPAALDRNGRISNDYGIDAIPTTFIIDREGNIILKAVGGRNWHTPALLAAFEILLSRP
jgi:thiol-disulfide isomerase/thioredoxin